VLELAGVTKPEKLDGAEIPPAPGKSLVPALQSNVEVQRESLWWLHEGNRAVRVGNWKLVAVDKQPWELYDLSVDRAEQNNLAEKMPEKVRELEAVWQKQTDEFTALSSAK
jgi:arylsulfatase